MHKAEINKIRRVRRRNDPMFKLNENIRTVIRRSLHGNKNGCHWELLVDYNLSKLKKHLIKTIPNGYIWDDYLSGNLHIDHIIPISAFNFDLPKHIDFKRCWALSNLRLLPARENLLKSDKLEEPFQSSLKLEI